MKQGGEGLNIVDNEEEEDDDDEDLVEKATLPDIRESVNKFHLHQQQTSPHNEPHRIGRTRKTPRSLDAFKGIQN